MASRVMIACIAWLMAQAKNTLSNFYNTNTSSLPGRLFLVGILPAIIAIILLFATKKGRQFVDDLSIVYLTYLSVIRIFVELVLLLLFLNKAVPQLMTFEGRNFDIFSGITAPFIAYFGLQKRKLNRSIILTWNFICLALLINIAVNAVLSAPFPFQQFAFDQPNIAILNFPFSWLPTFIVPLVLFSHLVSIKQLIKNKVAKKLV